MTLRARPYQRFLSQQQPEHERIVSVSALLICGWTIAGASFVTSFWILPFNSIAALLLLFATVVFIVRMYMHTSEAAKLSSARYELIVTTHEAILCTLDRMNKRQLVESVLVNSIRAAEVIHTGDTISLSLITRGGNLEVPLSDFGEEALLILNLLRERGIPVVSFYDEQTAKRGGKPKAWC
jgi:hypothetical protein